MYEKMNVINICLDQDKFRLSGYDLGKEIYESQIKDKMVKNCINVINLPNSVTYLTISFVDGLIADIKNNISLVFESPHENVRMKAQNSLMYIKHIKER